MSRKDHAKEERRRQAEYARISERNRQFESDPKAREKAIDVLNNPIARKAVALSSRGRVLDELSRASTEDQISVLSSTAAGGGSRVRNALMKKAPGEMDKAIRKFMKEGKEVSVETLTAEAKSTPSFVKLCNDVGLSMEWFEDLARKRMEAFGL